MRRTDGLDVRERGTALIAVLLTLALLLPLGALAVLRARSGFLLQQSLRGDAEALHAADAGLACALSRLDPRADFGQLLRGRDGIAGSADDGSVPFALDCAAALAPPLRFEVRLEAGTGGDLVLVSTGYGGRGASRVVERRLHRVSVDAFELGGWRER